MPFGPVQIGIFAVLILSLSVHEAAHAWAADRLGDSTARLLGRLTLNPLAHIDPFLSVILPAALWFGSGGRFLFGGGKPVPVDVTRLRRPTRDWALVSLAGPASNLVLVALFTLILLLFGKFNILSPWQDGWKIVEGGILVNLLLAAFNMLPVPPLDGSRVLAYFLPREARYRYLSLERHGFLLLLAIIFLPRYLGMPSPLDLLWSGFIAPAYVGAHELFGLQEGLLTG